jgi:hypothetical protein
MPSAPNDLDVFGLRFALIYASEMLRGSLLTGAREEVARGTVSGLDQISERGAKLKVVWSTTSLLVSVDKAETIANRGVISTCSKGPLAVALTKNLLSLIKRWPRNRNQVVFFMPFVLARISRVDLSGGISIVTVDPEIFIPYGFGGGYPVGKHAVFVDIIKRSAKPITARDIVVEWLTCRYQPQNPDRCTKIRWSNEQVD